jgi:hypothetical protein
MRLLDGSLSADEEAELLHRLSVSPERREMLRSYLSQREIMKRDRDAIHVPFRTEEKLWARLNTMMSDVPVETAVIAAKPSIFHTNAFRITGVAALMAVIGFVAGYYLSERPVQLVTRTIIQTEPTQPDQSSAQIIPNTSAVKPSSVENRSEAAASVDSRAIISEPIIAEYSAPVSTLRNAETKNVLAADITPQRIIADTRSDYAYFTKYQYDDLVEEESFWRRFEVHLIESFGKQLPDNTNTRVSFPLITNSSLTVYYQPFSGTEFRIGAGLGLASVARKGIVILPTNDPKTKQISGQVTHNQTSWAGGFAQYRIPIMKGISLAATLGLSGSGAGMLTSGELGARFQITSSVGAVAGVRFTDVSYSLNTEVNDIISRRVDGYNYGYSNDIFGVQHSHNIDFVTGLNIQF